MIFAEGELGDRRYSIQLGAAAVDRGAPGDRRAAAARGRAPTAPDQQLATEAIGCQGAREQSGTIAVRSAEDFERTEARVHIKHLSFVRGSRRCD
nr:hypothetical protein [Saccharopolyspora shandongensis]